FLVQALGVAVLATILGSTLSPDVKQFQRDLQTQTPVESNRLGLCERQETNPQVSRACEENLSGFARAYRFTFYAALVALVLGAFLPGFPFEWAGRGAIKAWVTASRSYLSRRFGGVSKARGAGGSIKPGAPAPGSHRRKMIEPAKRATAPNIISCRPLRGLNRFFHSLS